MSSFRTSIVSSLVISSRSRLNCTTIQVEWQIVNGVELLVRGLLAGLFIAAPVGPVNVLCISRTLVKGWRSGLVSGFGAATADTLYGCIAGFSITFIIQFLLREEFWIRLFGGILLVLIGVRYYFKQPQSLSAQRQVGPEHSDYISTLFLNLTNPTTVLSFLAILATLGMKEDKASWLTLLLVAGIFCGSMLWWIVLIGIVNRVRDRIDDHAMLWMNRVAGVAIGGFGVVTFVMSRVHAG
jgi:threonine/homoserine/homoserine lactone efflux protein